MSCTINLGGEDGLTLSDDDRMFILCGERFIHRSQRPTVWLGFDAPFAHT